MENPSMMKTTTTRNRPFAGWIAIVLLAGIMAVSWECGQTVPTATCT